MPFERWQCHWLWRERPGAWPGKRRRMAIDGVKLGVPDIPANISDAYSLSGHVILLPPDECWTG